MTECCIACKYNRSITNCDIISICLQSFPILFDYGNLVFLEWQRICGSCNGFGILPQQKMQYLRDGQYFYVKWQYQLFLFIFF